MKSQIHNKNNGGIVELLIPTLNKIIRNQSAYFDVVMENLLKIISVNGAAGGFIPKETSHEEKKSLLGKKMS